MITGQTSRLRRSDMAADPISQFRQWFQTAKQGAEAQPEAMILATSNRQGHPTARTVLLRGIDERGFVFFTNYESRKAQDLAENPVAALVFCWPALSRQVRVEGSVEMVDQGVSDDYFAGRPRGHQLAAHTSPQSQIVKDRAFLEERFVAVTRRFPGEDVPRPPHWGGYRVVPESLEFWQEGEHRLHDRLRYRRNQAGVWLIERLAP